MKGGRSILTGIGIGAALAALIFAAFFFGIFIGRRENRFFPYLGGRHMHRDFIPKDFGHGAIGTIESLGENTIVVRDRTDALKTVLVDNQTQIRRGHTGINFSDLKKDEQVIVLGDPEEKEGAIKAKLIRVMGSFDKEATRSGTLRLPHGGFGFHKG